MTTWNQLMSRFYHKMMQSVREYFFLHYEKDCIYTKGHWLVPRKNTRTWREFYGPVGHEGCSPKIYSFQSSSNLLRGTPPLFFFYNHILWRVMSFFFFLKTKKFIYLFILYGRAFLISAPYRFMER